MRVLLVGGTGLLGSVVRSQLTASGAEVVTLARGLAWGDGPSPEIFADICRPDFGLERAELEALRGSVTHIVSSFGSVEWGGGPGVALQLHRRGTANLMDFADTCPDLQRFVHVSSILALGTASGVVGNAQLELGQSFRSWYEYGKFLAEQELRRRDDPRVRIIRFGPILGGELTPARAATHGLLSVVPPLLRGYPLHLERAGRFPAYPADVAAAAQMLVRALDPGSGGTWTYYAPESPTLERLLFGLCSAWGVAPRIVDMPWVGRIAPVVADRLGFPAGLTRYSEPWVDLDPEILDEIPFPLPVSRPRYVELTGEALRSRTENLC